jgi:hypothetical protein
MYIGIRLKYLVMLVGFWSNLKFHNEYLKIPSNLLKIHPVGAQLFDADRETEGQTDMTKLIIAFRNFANAPKNES